MSMHVLGLEVLDVLDEGKAAEAFSHHLRRVAADCIDRPGEGEKRTVTLKVTVVPDTDAQGNCDKVNVQFHVESAIPKHRTRAYSMGLRRNGTMIFNEDSLENVDQGTFNLNGDE